MSKRWLARRLLSAALSVVFLFLFAWRTAFAGARETAAGPPPTVILDAGHGGPDGGATGINGVHEKDLNLAVVFLLAELLEGEGVEVILTRADDTLPITEEQDRSGHRKKWDVTNRIGFTKLYPDALLVSIHMNRFPVEKYHGLQVWYAETPGSAGLAASIRQRVVGDLQPGNTRECKTADGSIRLLKQACCTAVLVECGFLSNREECEKLCSVEYQRELSFSIFCGIMDYVKRSNGAGT